jgi:probable F420-dependent oxidoreductase
MKYGITMFPTDYSIRPGELAAAVEQRGFESLWVPEHSHLPVSDMTPGRDTPGLPNMYYEVVDPFVALSMAAEATRTLLLGTSICLVVQRDPIQLAKQVASLDALSGGRFLFGVGAGWNPLEMANHGTAFAGRLSVMRERIEAMKAIWTEEKAEYHGKHVDFGPMYAWPKPCQKPHPPIHVAGSPPKVLKRVVAYGDGWIPLMGDDPLSYLPALHQLAVQAGRNPDAIEITVHMCPPEEDTVRRLADGGVHRIVFLIEPEPREAALRALDGLAQLRTRCKATGGVGS